jgi:uncharacterized protein
MDVTLLQLAVYLTATFFAALVAGVSGFAFALIAAAAWLHVLTPLQTATLVVAYALIVQGYGTWKMRHAVRWARLWPFVAGGVPGVAAGAFVLQWADPGHMRAGIGAFLVLYALYSLTRPALGPVSGGTLADTAVGFASGVLGGMTGFAGILIVVWSGIRGWSPDEQRGVFQPASVALLLLTATAIGLSGSIARETLMLFLVGLPALLAGTWAGFSLYGTIDAARFRRITLVLLLLSGVPLIAQPVLGG